MNGLTDKEKALAKEIIRKNWNSDPIEYQKRHKLSTDYVHTRAPSILETFPDQAFPRPSQAEP